jgi:putative NIF3 family GTP cyclohydrolase 1 type 2
LTTINDLISFVSGLSGHPLNWDEGIHHGAPHQPLSGVTVCWMASPAAIERAGRMGHQLLIGHESLYYPYQLSPDAERPAGWMEWQVNRQRRETLERFGLSFLRIHGSADEICIFDDFAALLDLGLPIRADCLAKVFEIEPCTLGELVERVKGRLKMPLLRLSPAGPMDRVVRRVGLPWGGLGLFVNVGYQQELIELGCDVFIAGESDNYGFRFAEECGIPMIETSHETSENPGLKHFTAMLAEAFPQVEFLFFENPCVWHIV